jgi:hypothetical protein
MCGVLMGGYYSLTKCIGNLQHAQHLHHVMLQPPSDH